MIKTRVRKIIRDILARKGRTALVSIAIFIGVLGTITLCTMSFVIINQLNEDINKDELAMLDVFVGTREGDFTYDDAAYLEGLQANVPDITEVMAVAANEVRFKIEESDDELERGGVYAVSTSFEDMSLEPMRLIDDGGAYPTAGANEVIVEKRMADEYGLDVGDTLYLRIQSKDETGNGLGRIEPWTISGIVFHPYAGGSSAFQTQPRVSMYALTEDAQYITGIQGFNVYRARFTSVDAAEEAKRDFSTFLADNTPYGVIFSQVTDPDQNQLLVGAQTLTGTLSFLAVLALVVSGFLVINVISSLVTEQKRQIGIMKTIGASQRDNFFIYSGIAFGYGLLAVIFAVPLGIILGNWGSHVLAPQLNTLLEGFQISLPAIAIGLVLGLAVPVLAAFFPVFFGTRVRILEAITDLGITNNYGNGILAKIIAKLPVPITVRQGLSNISMKKIRLIFTVITLAIAVGAFVGIFGMLSAIQDGFGSFLDTFNVEIGVFPNSLQSEENIVPLLEEAPNIQSVESAVSMELGFKDYEPEVSAGGPPGILGYGYDITSDSPAFNFTIDEGAELTEETAEDGIILTSNLASGLKANIGDTVTLEAPAGSVDVKVVGIVEYPISIVWADWHLLSRAAGFTVGAPIPNQYFTTVDVEGVDDPVGVIGLTETFGENLTFTEGTNFSKDVPTVVMAKAMAEANDLAVGDTITINTLVDGGTSGDFTIVGLVEAPEDVPGGGNFMALDWQQLAVLENRDLEGEPLPQGYFLITTLDDASAKDVDKVLDDLDELLEENGVAAQTFNFVELTEQFTQAIAYIQYILQGVVLLIAMVGALGLLTTLSMSVYERQKEIGVMRSIGADSKTVAGQFLTEGIVVGFIAWVVGLPIAALIQYGLLKVTQFDEVFGFTFDWQGALIALVGVMIISTIASLWPSFAAARKTVSEILRYQ